MKTENLVGFGRKAFDLGKRNLDREDGMNTRQEISERKERN